MEPLTGSRAGQALACPAATVGSLQACSCAVRGAPHRICGHASAFRRATGCGQQSGPGPFGPGARRIFAMESVAQRSEPFAVNEGDTGSNPVAHPNAFVSLTLHFGSHVDGAHRPHDSRDAHRAYPAAGVQSQIFDPLSDSSAGEHLADNREAARSNRAPTTRKNSHWPSGF